MIDHHSSSDCASDGALPPLQQERSVRKKPAVKQARFWMSTRDGRHQYVLTSALFADFPDATVRKKFFERWLKRQSGITRLTIQGDALAKLRRLNLVDPSSASSTAVLFSSLADIASLYAKSKCRENTVLARHDLVQWHDLDIDFDLQITTNATATATMSPATSEQVRVPSATTGLATAVAAAREPMEPSATTISSFALDNITSTPVVTTDEIWSELEATINSGGGGVSSTPTDAYSD